MVRTVERPVDLAHLDRYTGGSRVLNEEILRLFETQCRQLFAQLESLAGSHDAKSWHEIMHTLKGAARGVGAFALADVAAEAEAANPADAASAKAAISRLRAKGEAVRHYIEIFFAR